jgi:hypothetical protein
MSWFKANKLVNVNGTVRGVPVNMVSFPIPYSAASVTSSGYISDITGFSFANTAQLYTFTYYPVKSYSYIVYNALLDVDSGSGTSYNEHLITFINGTPYSTAYFYRRNAGHEPMSKSQSGVYLNTNGQGVVFSIRGNNNAGSVMTLGQAYGGGDQGLANRYTIFEVQR